MPSGSRKRKSSKKPKPLGGPPELEAGLEDAMENNGLEVGEATPSPRGIEGDPEAMAERGLDGKEMNGEVPQERDAVPEAPKEGFQTDEPAPDQDEGGQGDPPSQAEPEPEIPAEIEAEAPAVFELEGEPAQGETVPQIDSLLMEFEVKTDVTPEEIKPETELDAMPVQSEPITDATPDASPDEIKPDADVGMDEVEPSKESAILERESVLDAAPIGSESGMDESSVETETKAEVEPSKESAILERESVLDAAPIGSESGMDESSVETEPKTDAASADIGPEIDIIPDEFKLETDAAPAEVESEIGEPLVEVKPEADATPYIELETTDAPNEVPVEAEGETDGAPVESKPEAEEAQVEELETAAPANIELENKKALTERELETDAAPMDVEAEVEEALAERELAIDAATAAAADAEPETDAAPANTEAETDTVQVEKDTSPDEIPPEIDAASSENEIVEIQPDVNVALVEAEQDEVSQAVIEVAPELEPEVEVLVEGEPEVNAKDVDNSAEIEAKAEPPQETEPEPKTLDIAEDRSLESLQEIESESEVVAMDEAKLDETLVETKAEERGPVEIESDQQDLVDGEVEAPPEIKPEPEVETSWGIELEAEAEVPLEADPEPVVEAPAEVEPEEKGHIEKVSDQQDLAEIEPDQSGIKEHEEGYLQKQDGENDFGELDAFVSEDNQPSESQLQVADASVIEDDPPAISAFDKANSSTSSISSSDSSDNTDNERTAIEQETESNDIPPSASVLEGDGGSTVEGVSDNQDSGVDVEQACGTAVDTEQGAADELLDESKEDITEQERALDVGLDEDGVVLASAWDGDQTEESSEQELAIELPPADAVDVAESAKEGPPPCGTAVDTEQGAADELLDESKEDISEQERAVDVGLDVVLPSAGDGGQTEESSEEELAIELPPADVVDVAESAKEGPPPSDQEPVTEQERAVDVVHAEDRSVSAPAGNGGEVEVASDQELGIELPPPDVVDVAESVEGPPPSDQEPVTQQPQPLIDEQDLSMGLGAAADECPSVESGQSLNATLLSSESEMTSDAPEPQDEAVTPANDEKVASEHELNLESACGELEKDIGEEEAASSTVAEVGSVFNDFDERAHYEQELPTDFPSTDQDVDIPDCKEFEDNLSTEAPESVETGFREQLDSEPSPAANFDANAGCGLEATSEHQEVLLESAEAAKPAEHLHSALVEEMSSDEQQLLSSSQPEQVVQDNGEDKVHSTKEVLANEELRTAKKERDACEGDQVAGNSFLGTSLPMIAGDELISKALTYLENGQQSLSSSEGPSNELVEHKDESSVHQSEANNTEKAEIHAMGTKELTEAEHNPMRGDSNNYANEAPVESASRIPEGRDIKGLQAAFRQESSQEASLPVVVHAQDRALEHVSLKSAERPSGGGTLERRTKLLGCCGMFDLLLGRN